MPQYLSTDPNAGQDAPKYLSTDPNAGAQSPSDDLEALRQKSMQQAHDVSATPVHAYEQSRPYQEYKFATDPANAFTVENAPLGHIAEDVKQKNYPRAAHELISTEAKGFAPLTIPALAAAPAATLGGLGLSAAGGFVGKEAGKLAGLSDDWSDLAADAGAIGGGIAGGMAGPKVLEGAKGFFSPSDRMVTPDEENFQRFTVKRAQPNEPNFQSIKIEEPKTRRVMPAYPNYQPYKTTTEPYGVGPGNLKLPNAGRLVLSPEDARSDAFLKGLSDKRASERGMLYAAGMRPDDVTQYPGEPRNVPGIPRRIRIEETVPGRIVPGQLRSVPWKEIVPKAPEKVPYMGIGEGPSPFERMISSPSFWKAIGLGAGGGLLAKTLGGKTVSSQ